MRGVIFDVDGTLVDSNDQHARAWVDALAEAGFPVPYDKVRPLIGMGGDKVLPKLTGLSDDDEKGKRIAERREQIFDEEYLPQVRPFPGARRDQVHRLPQRRLEGSRPSRGGRDLRRAGRSARAPRPVDARARRRTTLGARARAI